MKKLFLLFFIFFINGCSTYIEETNNKEFKPLTPSFEEFARDEPSNGSIYFFKKLSKCFILECFLIILPSLFFFWAIIILPQGQL